MCYLIRTAAPLCRQDIENALLGEQLVNYFELAGSLADLEDQGLVTVDENGGYHITPKGISVTDELGFDLLPRSVRETAIRAVIRAQQWVRKAAQHQTQVTKTDQGYVVHCSINELGSEVFGLSFTLPDPLTAEMVKNAFIEKGSSLRPASGNDDHRFHPAGRAGQHCQRLTCSPSLCTESKPPAEPVA